MMDGVGADSASDDNDSRTAAISAPASVGNPSSKPSRDRKRNRNRGRSKKNTSETALASDSVPMGASFSQSAAYLDATNSDQHPTSTQTSKASDEASITLGKNRLATGFALQPPPASAPQELPTEPRSSHRSVVNEGSDDTPIDISSDESDTESDDEGGMVVNIDQDLSEDGQVRSDDNEIPHTNGNFIPPPPPPTSKQPAVPAPPSARLKLEDLSPDELELQIKYALFHLGRDQIDLNREVTCLACFQPGHMATECAENNCNHCTQTGHSSKRCPELARCSKCRQIGHDIKDCSSDMRVNTVPCDVCGNLSHIEEDCPQRFFASSGLRSTEGGPVRLWISCCICASKSHLVGDCPDADRTAAARWSLKSLASGEYVNLSIEAGIKGREHEAENRNMRPAGVQIRGRADIRHAESSGADSSSEADEFFRPPVQRRQAPNFRFGNFGGRDQPPRFEGQPAQGASIRGRGSWYNTDSFGRRRSRSPMYAPNNESWRSNYRREPSPRRFDGYSQNRPRSPPRGPPRGDQYHPENRLPPKPTQSAPGSRLPSVTRQPVSLPTRKGSNPNLASRISADASSIQTPQPNPFDAPPGKRKNKKKKQKAQVCNTTINTLTDDGYMSMDTSSDVSDLDHAMIISDTQGGENQHQTLPESTAHSLPSVSRRGRARPQQYRPAASPTVRVHREIKLRSRAVPVTYEYDQTAGNPKRASHSHKVNLGGQASAPVIPLATSAVPPGDVQHPAQTNPRAGNDITAKLAELQHLQTLVAQNNQQLIALQAAKPISHDNEVNHNIGILQQLISTQELEIQAARTRNSLPPARFGLPASRLKSSWADQEQLDAYLEMVNAERQMLGLGPLTCVFHAFTGRRRTIDDSHTGQSQVVDGNVTDEAIMWAFGNAEQKEGLRKLARERAEILARGIGQVDDVGEEGAHGDEEGAVVKEGEVKLPSGRNVMESMIDRSVSWTSAYGRSRVEAVHGGPVSTEE